MKEICDDIIQNLPEVLNLWEQIAREEPWVGLPPEHRINGLPELVMGLVDASLCDPLDIDSQHAKVRAAAAHGESRRKHGFQQEQIRGSREPDHRVGGAAGPVGAAEPRQRPARPLGEVRDIDAVYAEMQANGVPYGPAAVLRAGAPGEA